MNKIFKESYVYPDLTFSPGALASRVLPLEPVRVLALLWPREQGVSKISALRAPRNELSPPSAGFAPPRGQPTE